MKQIKYNCETIQIPNALYERICKCHVDMEKDLTIKGVSSNVLMLLIQFYNRKDLSITYENVFQLQCAAEKWNLIELIPLIQRFLDTCSKHSLIISKYLFDTSAGNSIMEYENEFKKNIFSLINNPLIFKIPPNIIHSALKAHQKIQNSDIFVFSIKMAKQQSDSSFLSYLNTQSLSRKEIEIIKTIPQYEKFIDLPDFTEGIQTLISANTKQISEFSRILDQSTIANTTAHIDYHLLSLQKSVDYITADLNQSVSSSRKHISDVMDQIKSLEKDLDSSFSSMQDDDSQFEHIQKQIETIDSRLRETKEAMKVLPK